MNKVKTFFGGIIKNILFGIKTSYYASKKYFLLKCLILSSTTVLPLISQLLWRDILNGISNINTIKDIIAHSLIIYLSLKILIYLLAKLDNYVNIRYSDELSFYIESVMMEKTSRMDISLYDSASMGDKVRHARNNFRIMTDMTWLVFSIISAIINVVATFIIVCAYKWWIGTVTLFLLIPFMLYNKKHTEKLLYMEKEQIRDNRKKDYYNSVFFQQCTV